MFHVCRLGRTVVMIALAIVVMMEMLVAVDRAADNLQAVMMPGVRGENV